MLVGAVVLCVVIYRACSPSSSLREADSSSERSRSKGSGNRVVPVITAKVTLEDFSIRRRTIGIMESPAIVVVKSRIDSLVLEQHVHDGQVVKKGDLLFTLDDREIKALIARDEAQLAKDNATLTQAQADLGRKEELIEKNVAPRQQLDQATAVFKAAQQTVEADQAVLQADRLKLGYANLEASIAGRVGAVRVTPGNLVGINDPTGLVTITQLQPIRVGFTLAERDLATLRKAYATPSPAGIRVYSPGSSTPIEAGMLDFVDSSVDFGVRHHRCQGPIQQRQSRAVAGNVRGRRDRSRYQAEDCDDSLGCHPERPEGAVRLRRQRRPDGGNAKCRACRCGRRPSCCEVRRGRRRACHRRRPDAPNQRRARRRGLDRR